MAIVALVLIVLGLFGVFEPSFLVAVFALVCGITIYEAAFEVARTLLNARGAALSMILRAVLTVGVRQPSLYLGGGARGLAIAIAIAHIDRRDALAGDFFQSPAVAFLARRLAAHRQLWLAAAIVFRRHRGRAKHRPVVARPLSRARHARHLRRRRRHAAAELHRAGRSHHPVAGHSRQDAGQPRQCDAANRTLQKAFTACLTASTFGAAFFIVFGHVVLKAVLQPEFIAPTENLIPLLAIAFAFMTMRNFYFAQVIYFTNASYLELVVSLLFLVASAGLSLLLVPAYGPHGAALALMTASIIGCLAFMMVGRRRYKMPIDFIALGVLPSLALLIVFAARTLDGHYPRSRAGAGSRCRAVRGGRHLCGPPLQPVRRAAGRGHC